MIIKAERNQAIIREYSATPPPTLRMLAEKYGISIPRVHEIIHRRRPPAPKPRIRVASERRVVAPKPRIRVKSGRRVVANDVGKRERAQ